MSKSIYRLSLAAVCLTFVLTFLEPAAAQKRRRSAPKKAAAVENLSDEEKAAALENLQGAKVLRLLAELQLGLAEAYLENRNLGEAEAGVAMNKLIFEKIKNPTSLYTIYANARGSAVWMDYLLDRNGFGKDAESDSRIKSFHESLRRDVEKGSAVKADSAHVIAARGTLREFDCRLGLKSAAADCYDAPLADFSRAIALLPDETDFFSLRAAFYERGGKTDLAARDNQAAESLGNALGLKLELDKKATARRPFHTERANAEMLYFMKIVSLLQDSEIEKHLERDAAALKTFREKLLEYYTRADESFAKANAPQPSAENLERRAALRLNLGIFVKDLGFEQPTEFAEKTFAEAVAFYTDAIKLAPKFAEAYEDRARAYRKLNKSDLADADQKQFDLLKGKATK